MKAIRIALKDLTQSFRNAFALVFMFAVPLLMTGMFYLMFGSQATKSDAVYEPPITRLVIANLDRGDEILANGLAADLPGSSAVTLGDVILETLQNPDLAHLISIELVDSESEAREKVDQQAADAALIISSDFSENYGDGHKPALATLYSGSSQTVSSEIVKAVVGPVLDTFSGVRIAVDVFSPQMMTAGIDPETAALMTAGAAFEVAPQSYWRSCANAVSRSADGAAACVRSAVVSVRADRTVKSLFVFILFVSSARVNPAISTVRDMPGRASARPRDR